MIETTVRTDLNDPRVTSMLFSPENLHLLHAPEGTKPPYIEYEVLSGHGKLYSEGDLDGSVAEVQIDIYTHGSYVGTRDKVLEVMTEKGYIIPAVGGFGAIYEKETSLFHCILRLEKEY